MNVAFDRWIPVVTLEGHPRQVSLCEIFTEGHQWADLAVRPHERVALMRLFMCVAHAALDGPKDEKEWYEVPNRLPKAAEAYLEKWRDTFEVFHPTKPWLQIADLQSGKGEDEGWGPVSKLSFFFASGNNTTLFDHDGMGNDARSLKLASTLLSLLSFQCFSLGGTLGRVYWAGSLCGTPADPKKANGPVKSNDGPCSPASMVHASLRGNSILATLHANLPTQEDIRFSYGDFQMGRPVWEHMPKSLADMPSKQNATQTYLGRLAPLTRFIRLNPNGSRMLLGDGLGYPNFASGFPPEPTAVVLNNKNERFLLSYRPGHALWRELAAICVNRNADGVGGPLSLQSLPEGLPCDLVVSALARGQGTIDDTTESVYHIPGRLRSPEGASVYQAGVQEAENLAWKLGRAIADYRSAMDGGWEGRLKSAGPKKNDLLEKLHGQGLTHFWTAVEKNLGLLMAHIEALGTPETEPTLKAWRAMLFCTAIDAYESVCSQETPRQMKAFMEGWKELTSQPKPKTDNPEDSEKPKKQTRKRKEVKA